jgi:hypothetical protein
VGSQSGSSGVLARSPTGPSGLQLWPGEVLVRSLQRLDKVCRFKNDMLKLKKLFTIFKNKNHFSELKQAFFWSN